MTQARQMVAIRREESAEQHVRNAMQLLHAALALGGPGGLDRQAVEAAMVRLNRALATRRADGALPRGLAEPAPAPTRLGRGYER